MTSAFRSIPRQERSNIAIENILDAAVRRSTKVGLDELTIIDVAKEAGVSVGKVYYWFADKDALISAARTRTQAEFAAFLAEVLQNVDIDNTAALVDTYVRRVITYLIDRPSALELLDATTGDRGSNPFRELMTDLVSDLLEARVEATTPNERRWVSITLVTMLIGFGGNVVHADPEHRPALIDEAVYVLFGYLHARYPLDSDHVWSDPSYPVQPARAVTGRPPATPVHPAEF